MSCKSLIHIIAEAYICWSTRKNPDLFISWSASKRCIVSAMALIVKTTKTRRLRSLRKKRILRSQKMLEVENQQEWHILRPKWGGIGSDQIVWTSVIGDVTSRLPLAAASGPNQHLHPYFLPKSSGESFFSVFQHLLTC